MTTETPTDELIELILGCKQFSVISDKLKASIERTKGGDYRAVCHIENNPGTINYDGNELPVLRAGLWRLWSAKDWENSENRRKAALKHNDEIRSAWLAKVAEVEAYYVSLGTTVANAKQIVGMLSPDMVEAILANLALTRNAVKPQG